MPQVFLYLDESGDLGFDWSKKRTSSYFVITILLCEGQVIHKALKKAVSRTIKNKLNTQRYKKLGYEVKGNYLTLAIKKYLFQGLPKDGWSLYSVVLNKKVLPYFPFGMRSSNKLYNYLTKILLDQIPFDKSMQTINLIVDQCKNSKERQDFNHYLKTQLEARLPLTCDLNITHEISHESLGIQLVDLFCWGIARKYISGDCEWYDYYKDKIIIEHILFK